MKKLLSLFLSLGVLLSLVACGSSNGGDAATEADMAKEDRVEEATIELYAPAGKNTDYLLNALDLYNEEFGTDLKLNTVDVAPSDPMVQKITPMLVANEKMPELIFLQDSHAGGIFDKFEDLFLSSERFGFVEEHGSKFYEAKMNMLSNIAPSKTTYGFPNDWGNAVMFYNNEAFEEAGVNITEDVQTWDDFIEAGLKLKEVTGKKLLFMRDSGELDLVKYLIEAQGVSLFDEEGNANMLTEASEKAYEIILELIDKDLVAFGEASEYTQIGQETGSIFAGGWLASYQEGDFPDDVGKWRIGKMPQVIEGVDIAPMSGGSSFYIMKNSDNALAAYQFISYVLTDMDSLGGYMDIMGLPANIEAYETDYANREFPYYGGQQILKTLDEISQNSINGYVFAHSADINPYIEAASTDIIYKDRDVLEALEDHIGDFAQKYDIELK